jgi:predicted CXXCH cytochrome family protein
MTRKYAIFLSLVVMVAMATAANAQYSRIANIVTTNHNMSASTGPNTEPGMKAVSFDQICFFCHVPHQMQETTDSAVTTAPTGQYPLWNKTLSSVASYGVYSSPSFDALGTDIADLGGAVGGSAAVSNLCLSCHDGTVGVNTLYKGQYAATGRISPNFGGGNNTAVYMPHDAQIGSDTLGLRDEHPINFTYDATLAAKSASLVVPIVDPTGLGGGARTGVQPTVGRFLPLYDGKMQCSTCHDVHDNSTYRPFLRASTTQSSICLACHGK